MKTLNDAGALRGKRVFLRCDFNVPVTDGKIDDPFRIQKALPTIDRLRAEGARLVLASHIESEGASTLRPVRDYLAERFPVDFVEDYFPEDISDRVNDLPEGGVILLENLRKYEGEKGNDGSFAKHLALAADIYVNDAFASAHRPHASVVGVPKFIPGYAGLLLESEVANLSTVFDPPRPFVFILGGAKFGTKLPLLEKFLGLADTVFVGGALANDLLRARGANVGRSLLSEGVDVSRAATHPKLLVPHDVVVANALGRVVKKIGEVSDGDAILDVGPDSIASLGAALAGAGFILWNGPMGNFEEGFREGTDAVAKLVAESGARTVVGGGDTISSIASLGVEQKLSFVSTGGGAMLDFLAHETLPGIEALQ